MHGNAPHKRSLQIEKELKFNIMIVYKITDGTSFLISDTIDAITAEIEYMDENEDFQLTVSKLEMSEEEYNNLPEFDGW